MILHEWLRYAQSRLQEAGIEEARIEAQLLAAHVLRVDRTWIVAHPDEDVHDLAAESILQRRMQHEPLAYILGWREFYGRRFIVTPAVLIPRHETEVLVEAALELHPHRVLDLGTGSGCIALTLKLENPGLDVWASDASSEALAIAERNREELHADITLVHTDGFQDIPSSAFDLIVSNPPYVSQSDELPREVRDFEPAAALYAEGNGLAFYRRIAKEARRVLSTGGHVVMELGKGQFDPVCEIFLDGGWTFTKSWKDLSGIERVIAFQE